MGNITFFVKNISGGIDNYVKLMLHMDDVGLIDSSSSNHSPTLNGGISRSTTQAKFGGYSAYFDGSDDYIRFLSHDDFNLGTGDFTIDFWFYPVSGANQYHQFMSNPIQDNWSFKAQVSSKKIYFYSSSFNTINDITATYIDDVWQHIALVRKSNTAYIFVNGILKGTKVGFNDNIVAGDVLVGRSWNGATQEFTLGYIDELRLSKGIARWDTNFTPESGPYTI